MNHDNVEDDFDWVLPARPETEIYISRANSVGLRQKGPTGLRAVEFDPADVSRIAGKLLAAASVALQCTRALRVADSILAADGVTAPNSSP